MIKNIPKSKSSQISNLDHHRLKIPPNACDVIVSNVSLNPKKKALNSSDGFLHVEVWGTQGLPRVYMAHNDTFVILDLLLPLLSPYVSLLLSSFS